MNIIDLIIIICLILGFIAGFKKGFTRELVSFLGIFLIIIFAFLLKNPVSIFLYNHMPFINFGGIFKDLTVINILFYEMVAFAIVFIVLLLIFKLLLRITKIFEKFLSATIILGIPSKILGGIIGVLETYVYIFLAVYVISMPVFKQTLVQESKYANDILTRTPILNKYCDGTIEVIKDCIELKDEYNKTNNVEEYNQKVLNLMIENGVITKENAEKLIESGKIKGVVVE